MDQLVDLFTQYGLFFGLPLLFLLVVAWIYRPSAKKRYQADGNLPFLGDKKANKGRPGTH
ncbi:MAG: CcoQ/FixQ family Cbb3-type cytochrome c oxidase assembly chaperone [Gallionellaceae bacterium]|nr:CcoQ/FixQ family Cbb3-type cytochrome c oxidase assembly chaperone [Gallionellaceae bacterium]